MTNCNIEFREFGGTIDDVIERVFIKKENKLDNFTCVQDSSSNC
jgi:hypothetical protein